MKRAHLVALLGASLGALAGWLYWRFVGCDSGSCSITSDPLNSALYGSFMGGLIFNTIHTARKNNTTTTQ